MLRVATFNMENLDDKADRNNPSLEQRAGVLRAYLNRLNADILCLQEVHGQELAEHTANRPRRDFLALQQVLAGTRYEDYLRAYTKTTEGVPYNERNLLILVNPEFHLLEFKQHRNDLIETLQYRKVTDGLDKPAENVRWERPILQADIDIPGVGLVHILNLHLKSRLASNIAGQYSNFQWANAASWAEGYFLSSIKRVGQALETRLLLDQLFDQNDQAMVLVCGDFNAEPGEVPVEAICGRVENTGNPELRQRVLLPCSHNIAESIRFSHLHEGKGNLLDHILMSQAFLPHFKSANLHNENLHDESLPFASDLKYPESDHAPFVAEFF